MYQSWKKIRRSQISSLEFFNGVPVSRRQKYLGTEADSSKIQYLEFLRWCGFIHNDSLPFTTRIRNKYSLNVDAEEATFHLVWPKWCTNSSINHMKTKPAWRLHTLIWIKWIENIILIYYLPIPRETPMGKHQPLIRKILLLDINTPMLKKKLEKKEGSITSLSEVTVMWGYLMERDILVYPFDSVKFVSSSGQAVNTN